MFPIGEGIDGPLFDDLTMDLMPHVRTIRLRGRVVRFHLTLEELAAHGIASIYPQATAPDLLRLFSAQYPQQVLATDAERRKRIALPLPQLLQLEEWHHPDVMNKEKPSDTQCFRSLAKVLANGDPSLYRPTEPPNTDWRNWPSAGFL